MEKVEAIGGRQLLETDRTVGVWLDCEQDTRGWGARRKEANVCYPRFFKTGQVAADGYLSKGARSPIVFIKLFSLQGI